MNEKDLWSEYRRKDPGARSYSAWAFCGGGQLADKLSDLVVRGIKTATSSAHQVYLSEGAPIPAPGDICIILRDNDAASCVIRITDVRICRFREVTAEHARNEGEGDRSLNYWRDVHREFFTMELAEHGVPFDEEILVVCETFQVVLLPEDV